MNKRIYLTIASIVAILLVAVFWIAYQGFQEMSQILNAVGL